MEFAEQIKGKTRENDCEEGKGDERVEYFVFESERKERFELCEGVESDFFDVSFEKKGNEDTVEGELAKPPRNRIMKQQPKQNMKNSENDQDYW